MGVSLLIWKDVLSGHDPGLDGVDFGDLVCRTRVACSIPEVARELSAGNADILLIDGGKTPEEIQADLSELARCQGPVFAPVLALVDADSEEQIEELIRSGVECVLAASADPDVVRLELLRTLGVEQAD